MDKACIGTAAYTNLLQNKSEIIKAVDMDMMLFITIIHISLTEFLRSYSFEFLKYRTEVAGIIKAGLFGNIFYSYIS